MEWLEEGPPTLVSNQKAQSDQRQANSKLETKALKVGTAGYNDFLYQDDIYTTQCALGFFNSNKKVHELFHFYNRVIHKAIHNQPKKLSDIGLPKE